MINFNHSQKPLAENNQYQANEPHSLNKKERKQLNRLNNLNTKLKSFPEDSKRHQSLMNKINNLVDKLQNAGVLTSTETQRLWTKSP